ncbi:Serine phosphatase RsbU, regulator of sigma subunit [hydrothermal vent metagenome]|uniref:Serine phosphatase RsbU, regulator of sigma subunit n=1 Tax=hydrothermal vent metagenome TaxID=652676 RepID=A0A3B0YWS3_9ZZZZ
MSEDQAIRILIVDDDASSRLILKAQLHAFGYELLEAGGGVEAVERFETERPDLILMDINMPGMDGYQATIAIKELSQDSYVPILFVTSSDDETAISRCTDAGGDDFLIKPMSPIELQSRIRSALKRRRLYQQLQDQHFALAQQQAHEERDQELARELFSRIAHLGCLDEVGIEYIASSLMVFNGDMLLAERTPYGSLRVMLGDFTGHGLPAAVGSLPAAEIFYGMTKKGFHLSEVSAEINAKLHRILPSGIFCAAALIELNSENRQLQIWNGGLPHLLLFNQGQNKVRHAFDSLHLALGILSPESFDSSLETIIVSSEDCLLAYSDGIVETENPAGELYGDHRLIERLHSGHTEFSQFQSVLNDLEEFRGHAAQSDDLTLIEIPCGLENRVEYEGEASQVSAKPAREWSYQLTLVDEALAEVDPVPLLLQSLLHLQGLDNFRENLFTILTELYTNALDHGILQLDSAIKSDAAGFAEYSRLREERLQTLSGAYVVISLEHAPVEQGGCLKIRIKDSGNGFDTTQLDIAPDTTTALSGRGVGLVKNLCHSLIYRDGGNDVEAIFEWP